MHHTSEHKFSSPHGDFSFSINEYEALKALADIVFVPSRGFLFFYKKVPGFNSRCWVFVPSRGFLFFYQYIISNSQFYNWFSSPHGDFSFSIAKKLAFDTAKKEVFVPSRGFLFFYQNKLGGTNRCIVFVPSRGFLFFYVIHNHNRRNVI